MTPASSNRVAVSDGIPVICCLICGHAHPAKAWVWTPQDDQHAAVGVCAGCHDAAAPLRGGCEGRGCLCVDGNPGAAVTRNAIPNSAAIGWNQPVPIEETDEFKKVQTALGEAAADATPNSVRCPCSDPFCVLINAIKDYTGWTDTRAIDAAYRIKDAV